MPAVCFVPVSRRSHGSVGTRGVAAWVRHPGVWLGLLGSLFAAVASGAEVIPPTPRNHFNDYASVVRRETATQLNAQLAQFERDTSNQIVVAIFPKLQSDSSVEDYTVRVAERWGVGRRDRGNGAVLFIFQASRDIRIVTGYGLEGALPDALAKQIIENEIVPRFRAGDFDGGVRAGVNAMIAATRGEYRGTGRTAADGTGARGGGGVMMVMLVLFILLSSLARGRRNVVYGRRGRHTMWGGPWGGGGGFGGGGGGGSFSGGGGRFGGGGAGGRW
jgi:uncharacterized protein